MNKRKTAALCLSLLLCVSGCTNAEEGEANETAMPRYEYAAEELSGSYSAENASAIELNGSSASSNASAVSISGSLITIAAGGSYRISGTLDDGQIIVNSLDKIPVVLILDGCNINSDNSAPIYVMQSERTIVVLAEGSQNILSDADEYIYADGSDEPKAALYSKDDLVICGSGKLNVTANANNGIHSKDELVITGGIITVNAKNDAIKGKDSLAIAGGEFNLVCGGDALQSDNEEDASLGNIYLDGGSFTINSTLDGVQAQNSLYISGGTMDITTGSGAGNSSMSNGAVNPDWGNWGTASSDSPSAKALKAEKTIMLTGGEITINSSDDSVHSNGNVAISGGMLNIKSGDDAIHADGALAISGGNIEVLQSYEGLEGLSVAISGGNIEVTATDDGINSAGGSDTGSTERFGREMFAVQDGADIVISGGSVYVNSAGDGLDANGNIEVLQGVLIVEGSENSGNGALDYNGTAIISGGTVIASGASGMSMNFSSGSTQKSIEVFTDEMQQNTRITLVDENNNVLLSFLPTKQYSSVVLSSEKLTSANKVTAMLGGTLIGAEEFGSYESGGTLTGASEIGTSDLTETINSIGQSSGNQFGGNSFGGKQQR